jgi:hypothetical protein
VPALIGAKLKLQSALGLSFNVLNMRICLPASLHALKLLPVRLTVLKLVDT